MAGLRTARNVGFRIVVDVFFGTLVVTSIVWNVVFTTRIAVFIIWFQTLSSIRFRVTMNVIPDPFIVVFNVMRNVVLNMVVVVLSQELVALLTMLMVLKHGAVAGAGNGVDAVMKCEIEAA